MVKEFFSDEELVQRIVRDQTVLEYSISNLQKVHHSIHRDPLAQFVWGWSYTPPVLFSASLDQQNLSQTLFATRKAAGDNLLLDLKQKHPHVVLPQVAHYQQKSHCYFVEETSLCIKKVLGGWSIGSSSNNFSDQLKKYCRQNIFATRSEAVKSLWNFAAANNELEELDILKTKPF